MAAVHSLPSEYHVRDSIIVCLSDFLRASIRPAYTPMHIQIFVSMPPSSSKYAAVDGKIELLHTPRFDFYTPRFDACRLKRLGTKQASVSIM